MAEAWAAASVTASELASAAELAGASLWAARLVGVKVEAWGMARVMECCS